MSSTSGPNYLRTLPAVRERCSKIYALAQKGELKYFDLHEDKLAEVVEFTGKIITRDFGTNYSSIPPHSRWRHFCTPSNPDLLGPLLASWQSDPSLTPLEIAKRLLDLFVVSVLLDAGAGDLWKYTAKSGEQVGRSEGLGVGSLEFFEKGGFSAIEGKKYEVNAAGLKALSVAKVGAALQVTDSNPMSGLEGRSQLLLNLAVALEASPEIFGTGPEARPGNMLDFLSSSPSFDQSVHVSSLWNIVMDGFGPVWPAARTKLDGVSLGDAWVCEALGESRGAERTEENSIVPFHKLSQWLTYSLLEPIEKILGWKIEGRDDQTGLPEYRNGGLLIDLGFLTLKTSAFTPADFATSSSPSTIPRIEVSHGAVIEWRAVTVIALDKIAAALRVHLNAPDLTTAQVLESATWKGGREIAKALRGDKGSGPPLEIVSDGTVF
ncbi:DUF1688-domain-containing protein [Mrakia frigida]|uniref:URC4/urg3 family protein n=1 Tax=Mrakia frigida TaxID=29902 RepID=UPI003FCC0B25